MSKKKKGKTFYAIVDFETTGVSTTRDFPIQIGIIICDENLEELGKMSEYIKTPDTVQYYQEVKHEEGQWSREHHGAFKVHKIRFNKWQEKAMPSNKVVDLILYSCLPESGVNYREDNVYLVSDNIFFDMAFMKRMWAYSEEPWPFHYAGMDGRILWNWLGLERQGDPKEHDALSDCKYLLRHLKIAKEIIDAKRTTDTIPRSTKDSPAT